MKINTLLFIAFICLFTVSCDSNLKKKAAVESPEFTSVNYSAFGAKVSSDQIYSSDSVAEKYEKMTEGDTIDIAFTGLIDDVCKAKGCWMKVNIGNQKETMVKFKDYAFFVPTDTGKDSVIVQGKAYVSETSVDELRHLASDAGKSEAAISAIIAPQKTYSFMADGVLIKK